MTFLFPIKPRGEGTADIECLTSYVSRLADIHQVTLFQIFEALRRWDGERGRATRIKKGIYTLRLNGYSNDNHGIVDTLMEATGVPGLTSCSLLSLRRVGAGNGISALKHEKAWCSACYREWIEEGAEPYDKLIWQIEGIFRCEVHRIELDTACPSCGATQGGHSPVKWSTKCRGCKASLVADRSEWRSRPARRPYEAAIHDLLTLTSARPGLVFDADATVRFRERMISVYDYRYLREKLGESFKKPIAHRKMQLRTVAIAAQFFGISLPNLLMDPEGASVQLSLDAIDEAPLPERYHRGIQDGTYGRAMLRIQEAIEHGPPYPTLTSIAAEHRCHTSYLYGVSHKLTKRLAGLRRAHLVELKRAASERVLHELKENLASNRVAVKGLHRNIASRTGAPINLIRDLHRQLRRQADQAIFSGREATGAGPTD